MANTYKWDCKTVDVKSVDDKADVVFNVHWRLNATSDKKDADDNFYTAGSYGSADINTDDLSSFKEFKDVKEADVIKWVEDKIGEEEVQSMKDNLDAQIDDAVNPKQVTKTLEE